MFQVPNNPGYTPEYKELEEARAQTNELATMPFGDLSPDTAQLISLRWLAAEVRVMRLERALER